MSVVTTHLRSNLKLRSRSRRLRRALSATMMIAFALWLPGTSIAQVCGPLPPYLSPHDRFGFNVVYDDRCVTSDQLLAGEKTPCASVKYLYSVRSQPLDNYNIRRLKAGWFLDYKLDTGPVSGLSHLPVVRYTEYLTNQDDPDEGKKKITVEVLNEILGPAIDAHPSRLWVVGNEMDRHGQDARPPDLYAEDYHTIYQYIKNRDDTAKVALGAIVQPTPRRIEYLRIVFTSYRDKYGSRLPTDAFTLHSFILDETGQYGAGLPPEPYDTTAYKYTKSGTNYGYDDHGDIDIFESRIRSFRAFMKNPGITNYSGYNNLPLLITEYGILFGPDTNFSTDSPTDFKPNEVCNDTDPDALKYFDDGPETADNPDGLCFFNLHFVKTYLQDTLDFLVLNEQTNGLSTDGGRLVQAASWYSLQDQLRNYLYQVDGFNGNLVDRATGDYVSDYPPSPPATPTQMSLLGPTYRDYMTDTSKVGYSDYVALSLLSESSQNLTIVPSTIVEGDESKVTLRVKVRNIGNVNAAPTVTFFIDATFSGIDEPRKCSISTSVLPRCSLDKVVSLDCDVTGIEGGSWAVAAEVSQLSEVVDSDNNNAYSTLTVITPTPTPTFTPTSTPKPTPTFTSTPGATPTAPTPTPTPTFTPTSSPTPTSTITPTPRASRTPIIPIDPIQHNYLPALLENN